TPLVLLLGQDLRRELAGGRERQPLVLVVVDDKVADPGGQQRRRLLELLEQPRFAALAPLLVLERQVIEPLRGELVVVGVERSRLGGGPVIGGGRVRAGP